MSYTETTEESYICNHTRSSILWRHMEERCNPNGRVQRKYPTYLGTSHLFEDYQHFTTWATMQFGYLNKDANGKYWQLDKDLIQRGNKIYSESLCLFVPHRVNCLLTTRTLARGEYPLGVYFETKPGKFRANCQQQSGIPKFLGYFDDPVSAHRQWQLEKSAQILKMSEDVSLGGKLQHYLKLASERILADYESNLLTELI